MVRSVGEGEERFHGGSQIRRSSGPTGKRQGEKLREKEIHDDADDEADREIGDDGAPAEGRGRGGEQDGGRRE